LAEFTADNDLLHNNDEIENDSLMSDKIYVAYKEHNDIVLKMSFFPIDETDLLRNIAGCPASIKVDPFIICKQFCPCYITGT
jgi:hypothetical protein